VIRLLSSLLVSLLLCAVAAGQVVRVENVTGNGWASVGSGVIYEEKDGRARVLTAGHVFRDGVGQIRVDGQPSTIVKYSIDNPDLAVIETSAQGKGVYPLATSEASGSVRAWGYSGGRLGSVSGRVLSVSGHNLRFSGRVTDGNSGGPVFAAGGKICGIIWGVDDCERVSWATRLTSIRQFVSACDPAGSCPGGTCPVMPTPPLPQPPSTPVPKPPTPIPDDPCKELRVEFKAMVAVVEQHTEQVADLESRVSAIEAKWAELGSIQGTRGERGEKGDPGRDATPEQIQAALAAWINAHPQEVADTIAPHLPPIWFRKVDGRTKEEISPPEPVRLDEGFTFLLYPGITQEN